MNQYQRRSEEYPPLQHSKGRGQQADSQRQERRADQRGRHYIKEAYNELVHKVTWPSFSSLQSSAVLVMVASVIFALLVFAMDFVFRNGVEFVYKLLY